MVHEDVRRVKEYYDYLRWAGIDVGTAWGEELNKRIAFLLRECNPEKGLPLLDIGCGNGRYAIALAKMGFSVVGVDFDEKSIEEARRLSAKQDVSVDFICADITEADLRPGFGLAFSIQCFQYLRGARRDVCLHRINELLVRNGVLFVEMPSYRGPTEERITRNDSGDYIHVTRERFDCDTGEKTYELTVIRKTNDMIERKVTSITRRYTPSEIRELLRKKGFTNVRIYGDWDGREFSEACRMLFIGQKHSTYAKRCS